MSDFEALKIAMGDLDEAAVKSWLDEFVQAGGGAAAQALEACQAGMDIVGARYETGEYFVAELIFAGDLMASAAALLRPLLAEGDIVSSGKMVICTPKGDIHDIGKNIVKALLEAVGVTALGCDAPDFLLGDAQVRNKPQRGWVALADLKRCRHKFQPVGGKCRVKVGLRGLVPDDGVAVGGLEEGVEFVTPTMD